MLRGKINIKIFLLAYLILLSFTGTAAIIRTRVSGNWSNVNTWQGGILPQPGDEVIISANTVVNLNQTTANPLSSLTIENAAKLLVTVDGSGIHLNGDLYNNGELSTWVTNAATNKVIGRKKIIKGL